jgi:O-antigen ligase
LTPLAPAADTPAAAHQAPSLRISLERMRGGLLWLVGFSGAFVFVEPSPYEVFALLAIVGFVITGLAISAAVMPMVVLLILLNVGFSIAVVPVLNEPRTLTWVLVSWYLAVTAVFFAAMLGQNTEQRLGLLVRGYSMAAVVAATAAVAGYFHLLPGLFEMLTRFGRAQGTFNDPNVLGAFLVFPAMVALQRVLSSRSGDAMRGGVVLALLTTAVLLSFSRAAWGQLAVCAGLLLLITFAISRSSRERVRVVLLAVAGLAALALLIVALLSIDAVGELFRERASLEQSYDAGPTGRFGRYRDGFTMALGAPLGIGPLQFAKFFPEDPHNSYLNAFVSGGWLGGISYFTLVIVTLAVGFRWLFVPTPWQRLYVAIYVAFVGVALESLIIDTDHWRHYFLLLGVLWGLVAVSPRYRARIAQARLAEPPPHSALAPTSRPA